MYEPLKINTKGLIADTCSFRDLNFFFYRNSCPICFHQTGNEWYYIYLEIFDVARLMQEVCWPVLFLYIHEMLNCVYLIMTRGVIDMCFQSVYYIRQYVQYMERGTFREPYSNKKSICDVIYMYKRQGKKYN